MMDGLKIYWAERSPREQRLLMVAGALAAVLLLVLIARPVMIWTEQLQSSHRAAVEREGRVAAKAALLAGPAAAGTGSADSGSGASAGTLDQYLAQSASELGLSLSRNDGRGTDGASIAMTQAKAQVVMAWLADLERQGMILGNLTLTPQPDGTLGMTADVRRTMP